MYIVFLTGSIASGKSYVGSRLHDVYGIERIDLDQVSRDALTLDTSCIEEVVREFGEDIVADGKIVRSALARKAFVSDASIARLEAIELPYIKARMRTRLQELEDLGCSLCFVEVPVLDRFEDCFTLADEIIAVSADVNLRMARAMKYRAMTSEDFMARDSKQPSYEYLLRSADRFLMNEGTVEELDCKIAELAEDLKHKADECCC